MSVDTKQLEMLDKSARSNRNFKLYDDAMEDLDAAIEMIREAVASTGAGDPAENEKLMKQLADYLGMKGGIYRRLGKIDEALLAYREGYEIEKTGGSASYNLSNVIALSIVKDPSSLSEWLPEIERKIELLLDDEASLGKWWTHSDLGMFYLLSGQLDHAAQALQNVQDDRGRLRGSSDDNGSASSPP